MIELDTGAMLNRDFSEQDFIVIKHVSRATMETFDPCRRCAKAGKCFRRSSAECIAEYYTRWKEAGFRVPMYE